MTKRLEFDLGSVSPFALPLQLCALQIADAARLGLVVHGGRGASDQILNMPLGLAMAFNPLNKSAEVEGVDVAELPLQTRCQLCTAATTGILPGNRLRPYFALHGARNALLNVVGAQRAAADCYRNNERDIADTVTPLKRRTAAGLHGTPGGVCAPLPLQRARWLTQHHVDGACDAAVFGRSALDHFDALHVSGRQGVEGKAGGRGLTVDQNLCVATAQTSQSRGATIHGNARQAFEHIGDIDVSLAVEFVATVHRFGNRFTLAQGVVSSLACDNLHCRHRDGGRWGRKSFGDCARGRREVVRIGRRRLRPSTSDLRHPGHQAQYQAAQRSASSTRHDARPLQEARILASNCVVEYPATNGNANARPPQDWTSAVSGSTAMS